MERGVILHSSLRKPDCHSTRGCKNSWCLLLTLLKSNITGDTIFHSAGRLFKQCLYPRWCKNIRSVVILKSYTYTNIYIYIYVAGGFCVFNDDTKLHRVFSIQDIFRSRRLLFLWFCRLSYQVIDPKTKTTNIINTSLHNSLGTLTFIHYKIYSTYNYIRYNIYKQE